MFPSDETVHLCREDILTDFETISHASLFKDLFLILLSVGFVLAEATLYNNESFLRGFCECKEYVVATFEGDSWTEKIDYLCQVYESIEAMIVRPDEYLKMIKQREENGEPNSLFQRLNLMFRRKSMSLRKSTTVKENKSLEWLSFLAF